MANSYYEKIARINLSTGEIKIEKLDTDLARKFIGGRGLGTKMLYDEGVAAVDPLSADNKLIYITGPMTCSQSPASGRYMICTKSPLTGMIACSNSGGIWGAKLKYAGWDAIIVEGEAPEWTYINIVDDKIELLDAKKYVGMMSEQIDDELKAVHGTSASVLNIGPAGENKVLLAAIMNDKDRAAGRGGVGAVMGSKKLKAIVVTAQRKSIADIIYDIPALETASKECLTLIRKNGTCHRCSIACGRVADANDKIVGNDRIINDETNMICNEMGLDASSVPRTIAAAMELYQLGYIKEEECGGVPLEWGSTEALITWTKRMGQPDSELAWLMSSGSARLCEHYGHPEISRSINKKKKPAYDALSAVIDSMGNCLFTSFALGAPQYAALLNAATGTNYTPEELLEVGDRIYNIERMFNKAAGMKPEDDRLPKRLYTEPITDGPSKGQLSKIQITLPQYYEARGWVNAFPTDETLKKLGLDECVGKRGKILQMNAADFSSGIQILNHLNIPREEVAIFLINGYHSDPDSPVKAGDILAIFPPVGGG